jgi:hypothetical protein
MRLVAAAAGCVVFALMPASASSRPGFDRRCTPDIQIHLVKTIVAAFNAGDVATLDRLVAREPAFQWWSDRAANRLLRQAEDRSTLRAYALRRHRLHDHITLVNFGTTDAQGRTRLNLDLRRRADDYHPRNVMHAKQEAVCPPGRARIIVWSM